MLTDQVTLDAQYDICVNAVNPNQLLSAGGDSSLKLFDVASTVPAKEYKEHTKEVFAPNSTQSCPIDTKRKFYENGVLSGGSTLFKDFGQRLRKSEQQRVYDSLIENNRVSAKSNQG